MKRRSLLVCAAGVLALAAPRATAQTTTQTSIPAQDSIRVYELGEILVSDARSGRPAIQPAATSEITYRQIRTADATSVGQLQRLIPAARIQTNSRGETLLYLRNAGERQIGIFLDGTLLNIPWDNRIDLSLIPADIIGQITVSKGAHSILYGANSLGGAVNITTVERTGEGFGGTARLQAGEGNSILGSLMHDGRIGNFNYIVFGGYTAADGFLLPAETDDSLRYQDGRRLRTNTDMKRISLFGRAEYRFSELSALGLTVQHIDAEKGVAPEEHKTPSRVRLWRYADWKRTIASLNGTHAFDENRTVTLRGSVWLDNFGQTIDQYQTIAYNDLTRSSIDDDVTVGGRLTLTWNASREDILTFAASGYSSSHTETITSPTAANVANDYAQTLYSTGVEYRRLFGAWQFTLGATLDGVATPKTGVFPAQDGRNDLGAMIGVVYNASDMLDLFASVGRKTRYATPREQFSAALGRFITNPDLKPESGILSELGMHVRATDFQVQSSVFYNSYTDFIATAQVQDTMEQRVNLGSSIVVGWETSFGYTPTTALRIEGHYTYMYARTETDEGYTAELEYKPEHVGMLAATYRFPFGLSAMAEAVYTGRQMGEGIQIASSLFVNTRIAYQLPAFGTSTEVYVRLNNAFDTYGLSQIGLPDAGRTLYGGISVAF